MTITYTPAEAMQYWIPDCALKYNPQERLWDCPCHGSVFTKDGKLIDNPATGDIKEH